MDALRHVDNDGMQVGKKIHNFTEYVECCSIITIISKFCMAVMLVLKLDVAFRWSVTVHTMHHKYKTVFLLENEPKKEKIIIYIAYGPSQIL
jgi:hypothetical protein